jgi:hypothetical protein
VKLDAGFTVRDFPPSGDNASGRATVCGSEFVLTSDCLGPIITVSCHLQTATACTRQGLQLYKNGCPARIHLQGKLNFDRQTAGLDNQCRGCIM